MVADPLAVLLDELKGTNCMLQSYVSEQNVFELTEVDRLKLQLVIGRAMQIQSFLLLAFARSGLYSSIRKTDIESIDLTKMEIEINRLNGYLSRAGLLGTTAATPKRTPPHLNLPASTRAIRGALFDK